LWDEREHREPGDGLPLPHDEQQHNFDQYQAWLHRMTRTHITDKATEEDSDKATEEDSPIGPFSLLNLG